MQHDVMRTVRMTLVREKFPAAESEVCDRDDSTYRVRQLQDL